MESNEPIDPTVSLPKSTPEALAETLRILDELRGCTAGGLSGCDMLLEERRRECEMELAKNGW